MTNEPSKLVLVADDDEDTRAIVSSAVSLLGATPLLAKDGTEALARLRETEPDLAILDVMMPGHSGLEVCKEIKTMLGGPHLPVLILTARDGLQDKVSALEEGADDYLTKPFHFRELQARIKALLRVRELNLRLREKNLELQAMQQRLVEHERQLVVTQLGGTAAHQLGQPLSAIMLNCSLLEALPPSDLKYQRALEAIKSDARRMAAMIEQLKAVDAKNTEGYWGGMKILELDREKK